MGVSWKLDHPINELIPNMEPALEIARNIRGDINIYGLLSTKEKLALKKSFDYLAKYNIQYQNTLPRHIIVADKIGRTVFPPTSYVSSAANEIQVLPLSRDTVVIAREVISNLEHSESLRQLLLLRKISFTPRRLSTPLQQTPQMLSGQANVKPPDNSAIYGYYLDRPVIGPGVPVANGIYVPPIPGRPSVIVDGEHPLLGEVMASLQDKIKIGARDYPDDISRLNLIASEVKHRLHFYQPERNGNRSLETQLRLSANNGLSQIKYESVTNVVPLSKHLNLTGKTELGRIAGFGRCQERALLSCFLGESLHKQKLLNRAPTFFETIQFDGEVRHAYPAIIGERGEKIILEIAAGAGQVVRIDGRISSEVAKEYILDSEVSTLLLMPIVR